MKESTLEQSGLNLFAALECLDHVLNCPTEAYACSDKWHTGAVEFVQVWRNFKEKHNIKLEN